MSLKRNFIHSIALFIFYNRDYVFLFLKEIYKKVCTSQKAKGAPNF